MTIRLFDQRNIDQLTWLPTFGKAATETYLCTMVRLQPKHFIDNVNEKFCLLVVDDEKAIPIVINQGNTQACYLTSHTANYIGLSGDSVKAKVQSIFIKKIVSVLLSLFKQQFRWCLIDRSVYLNCWLIPTGYKLELSVEQIQKVTNFLCKRYPDYSITCRVSDAKDQAFTKVLNDVGYCSLMSRLVYYWQNTAQNFKKRDVKRGLALLKKSEYDVLSNQDISAHDLEQVNSLYQSLYKDKHSNYSIQYKSDWFELIRDSCFLTVSAFKNQSQIDAFICTFFESGYCKSSIGSFSQDKNSQGHLYNMNFAIRVLLAKEHNVDLYLSSGGDRFKRNRGAYGVMEYDAIYFKHLPFNRRMVWRLFGFIHNTLGKQIYRQVLGV